jgi:hypothetical protein
MAAKDQFSLPPNVASYSIDHPSEGHPLLCATYVVNAYDNLGVGTSATCQLPSFGTCQLSAILDVSSIAKRGQIPKYDS